MLIGKVFTVVMFNPFGLVFKIVYHVVLVGVRVYWLHFYANDVIVKILLFTVCDSTPIS